MKVKAKFFQVVMLLSPFLAMSQNPQGFFLDDFQPKLFTVPSATVSTKTDKPTSVNISVNVDDVVTPVSKYVFGNNANVWMGQMIDQSSLMNSITKLKPNIIRFPGGSLSGVYFWDALKDQPPTDAPVQIWDGTSTFKNAGYWYGKNSENWTLSVDNFYLMLQQTGNTGMITVNYDYARYSTAQDPVASAAHLAADWVRYDNGRTRFWEVGNESNGVWQPAYKIKTNLNQDNQPEVMSGELYGKHFKVFADSMRKAANEIGKTIYIGAQLLEKVPESWQTDTDKNWNTGMFLQSGNTPDFYIIHSYYTPYQTNATAAEILNTATTGTQNMMTYLNQGMTTAGVTKKPVALTEYNIFSAGSKQQASFVNGMHAAIVVAEAMKNKYGMASRWDLANGWDNGNDHGLFSLGDEGMSVTKWTPRATYFYLYYLQKCFGDTMIGSTVSGTSDVLAYSSKFSGGEVGMMLVNKSTSEQVANINIDNFGFGDNYYTYSLTGGADNGEFSLKVSINGNPASQAIGGPNSFESIKPLSYPIGSGIKVRLPARSVQYVMIETGTNVITGMEKPVQLIETYPNPSNGTFLLDLQISEESQLTILDLNGREMFMKTIQPEESGITIESKLTQGFYLLKVKGKTKTQIAKIIVQ